MLANTRSELDQKQKKFLSYFPHTLYAYIHDNNDAMPVVHSEILNLDNQKKGYGIFFTVNGFTGGKRTGENLTNINCFFCDIDYPDKMNRTREKLQEYKNDLLMELVDDNLPIPTYINETKNGLHVFWCLAEPIYLSNLNPAQQEELKKQYRDVEEAILKRFDGDPGAKDAARVLRIPGTLHQKDPKDPFEIKTVHYSDECVYTFTEIREAFLKKEAPDGWATAQGENAINEEVKEAIEKDYPKLERPSYKKLFSKIPGTVPPGMRNKALLIAAYAAKEAGWKIDKTFEYFNEFHGLGLREIRKTIRSAYEHAYDFGYNNEVMQEVVGQEERVELSKVTSKVLSKSTREKRETSNDAQKQKFATYEYVVADRFPHIKYKIRGDFYNYAEGVYAPLQLDEIRSVFLQEMLKDGLTNYRKISAVNDKIACFKSIEGRTFHNHEENPDKNVLNFKNGLLDITSYQMHAHTPYYLSTSQIPVIYSGEAKCPRWLQFLKEVTCEDAEQMKLLQQIAGYALTTDTSFAKAFIFFGAGANGKSLFNRIISRIVGRDATSSINLGTITKQFGLTGLIGKKVNFIDEISGNYFESNVIKGIISGEQMAAEVKYRPEPLEFTPVVKLIFSVNELPKINDTTPGLYRRFIIVPFDRSFEGNPDLGLEQKLTEELTGILNWAIEGLKSLRAEGRFNETERNFQAMRYFKSDNSPVVEFIHLYYEPCPEGEERKYGVPISELYGQYRNYCMDHGYKPKAMSNFSREIGHVRMDGFNVSRISESGKWNVYGLRRSSTMAGEKIIYPVANKHEAF